MGYNKIESQTSFASRFKTQIEDERMFCDFYNPKEGTYCKRLQVLCPDHNPDEKRVPRDDEVCGCPLQKTEEATASAEFCRSSKKACQAHYCWEKLRRAELDMERVKQWMKVDELLEQERQVRASMSNRAGVLGLLLHSTFNHEMEDRMQSIIEAKLVKSWLENLDHHHPDHLFLPLSLAFGRPVCRLLPVLDLSFEQDLDIIG